MSQRADFPGRTRPAIGWSLSSEEHDAEGLIEQARLAEQKGFEFALISDHFHPWTSRQGQSPFVWTTLGAIARETDRLVLGTGVTCPTGRIHPAIVAQAAATVTTMMPGRFFLGVGTGERLNEHVTGARWPSTPERRERLEEAIDVMRALWSGEEQSIRGEHFEVERATIFTCPDEPPPVFVAAGGPLAAKLAGRAGDGMIGLAPDSSLIDEFRDSGGTGPRVAQLTICWDEDEARAKQTALEWWPNAGLPGNLSQELSAPSDFEDAAALVTADGLAEKVVCGPSPDPLAAMIDEYGAAGYDFVYIHQVGQRQREAIEFVASELLPEYGSASPLAGVLKKNREMV